MSQSLLLSDPVPTVSLHDGRPAVTSLEVAKFFNKRHDNIVRDIRSIMGNCPENFTALNFEVSNYLDETGRSLPMYIIYRDGFMLLVMGYTGKKALAIKLAYIEAFNAMEEELARKNRPALPKSRSTRRESLPTIPGSIPRQSLDERPFLDFVEEVQQAHTQVQEIQERLLSKAYRLALTLCHDIEARTKVPVSKRSGKFTLERFLLDHMTYGLDEALTYPSDTLPDYRNPGLYLLGVLRQFNA
jgi:Rha family phage regulatory protein